MKPNRILALVLVLVLLVGVLPVAARAAALECEPYANVQYEYSEDVSVGTIRYIRQMPGRDYFYEEYWPEAPYGGYYTPKNECGTAVISMALSYVGVNKTPKEVLAANNGYTSFYGWEADLQVLSSISDGMERYINGEGKYSPVIIHMADYNGRGHYVLLAGRVSENVYMVVDPVKDFSYEITVNGRYCEYLDRSDYIDEIAQYYYPHAVMPEPPAQEPDHECDRGEYLYYYAEHPHYSVYRCSQCEMRWADPTATNEMPGCSDCVPDGEPEVLALKDMKATYTHQEAVLFHWNEVSGAARYSLAVDQETEEGWQRVMDSDPAVFGQAVTFPKGIYRAQIIAHSEACPEDNSVCNISEYHYFAVEEVWENPFEDVSESSYFYAPAMWAYYGGITKGVNDTDFQPKGKCTRAQVVTFLWRLAGKPQPQSTEAPFVDVDPGDFYYKAALWAAETGVTSGMDETHFAPDRTCTRAQVVTFLWRLAGKPEVQSEESSFTDLRDGAFYTKAVRWAVEAGIATGMSQTTFEPTTTCTRAQVVTFLYRYAE